MKMLPVRLKKMLEHAGQKYPPGTLMTLQETRASRLIEQGVAELAAPQIPALLKPPSTPSEMKAPKKAATTTRRCCGGFRW